MAARKLAYSSVGSTPVLRTQLLRWQGSGSGPGCYRLVDQRCCGCSTIGGT